MCSLKELAVQYITTESGEKTSVIVPIDLFLELVEDLEDLALMAERRAEPTISHEELVARLQLDGLQDVYRG